jgi:hypothetical protein
MAYSPVTRIQSASERALALVQRDHREYHPLVALARMAHQENVRCDPKLELEVHKAILPYVTPKLATQEVIAHEGQDRRILVSLFEERTLEDGRTVEVEVPLVTDVTDLVPLD